MTKEFRFVGIDPSSKTGLVILDKFGEVVVAEEIKATTDSDPQRMIEIVNEIKSYMNATTDKVIIENFAFNAKGRGQSFQYALGWMIRAMLYNLKIPYIEVAPTTLKNFGALNGKATKQQVIVAVERDFGFINHSDNIVDAYVLAYICMCMIDKKQFLNLNNKRQTIITSLKSKSK